MKTGDKIREERKAAGLTQAELARKLSVVQTVISEYETGKRNPKPPTLAKIANAIGCPLYKLIGGEDYKIPTAEEWGEIINMPVPSDFDDNPDIMTPYSKLNTAGKQKVVDYAEDLATMPKYQKDD